MIARTAAIATTENQLPLDMTSPFDREMLSMLSAGAHAPGIPNAHAQRN
jgi:hypothetical protein